MYVHTRDPPALARLSIPLPPINPFKELVVVGQGGGVAGSTTRIQKARVWGERAGGIDQFPGSEDSSSIGLES